MNGIIEIKKEPLNNLRNHQNYDILNFPSSDFKIEERDPFCSLIDNIEPIYSLEQSKKIIEDSNVKLENNHFKKIEENLEEKEKYNHQSNNNCEFNKNNKQISELLQQARNWYEENIIRSIQTCKDYNQAKIFYENIQLNFQQQLNSFLINKWISEPHSNPNFTSIQMEKVNNQLNKIRSEGKLAEIINIKIKAEFENEVRNKLQNTLKIAMKEEGNLNILKKYNWMVLFIQCDDINNTPEKDPFLDQTSNNILEIYFEILRVTTRKKKGEITREEHHDDTITLLDHVRTEYSSLNISVHPIDTKTRVAVNKSQGRFNKIYLRVLLKGFITLNEENQPPITYLLTSQVFEDEITWGGSNHSHINVINNENEINYDPNNIYCLDDDSCSSDDNNYNELMLEKKKRKKNESSSSSPCCSPSYAFTTGTSLSSNDKNLLMILLHSSFPRDIGLPQYSYFIKYYRSRKSGRDGIYIFTSHMESVFKNVKVVYRNVNEVEKALGIENYHELTKSDQECLNNPNKAITFELKHISQKVTKMFVPNKYNDDEGWLIGILHH